VRINVGEILNGHRGSADCPIAHSTYGVYMTREREVRKFVILIHASQIKNYFIRWLAVILASATVGAEGKDNSTTKTRYSTGRDKTNN
jgi:hypothetical protein